MTEQSGGLAADSWTFALMLYAKPGVQEACLHLQDSADVDVMLLLVAVFAASRMHVHLHAEDIRAMDDACRPWREQVVGPLRALRRGLVTGPAPAPSKASETLRSQVKAAELNAERLENDLLATWLESKTAGDVKLSRMEVIDVIEAVVRHVPDDAADRRTETISSSIELIADAAGSLAG